MTVAQQEVLDAVLAGRHTVRAISWRTRREESTVQHTLDALFRRSLVTLDEHGRYTVTGRGLRKAAA